jgi:hypothetical protein
MKVPAYLKPLSNDAGRPLRQNQDVIMRRAAEAEHYGVVLADVAAWINEGCAAIHAQNIRAGWWSDINTGEPKDRNAGEMLMLIVSEIAEAMEGVRKGLPDDKLPHRPMEEVELADAMIRIMDYAGARGFDLGGAIKEKALYNVTRADHKLETRRAEGGKAF